jgi:predicted amidophosphoribosyltransferase
MPIRFRKIDDASSGDHHFIDSDDNCHYMWEFTAGGGYSAGDNQLITNLKKKPSSSGEAELRYKARAIAKCASRFAEALPENYLKIVTFVPIPPSKNTSHPDYDDRIEQICRGLGAGVDVRNLVTQNVSMIASHERGTNPRPTQAELLESYSINEGLVTPAPRLITIVDDVLTAGTHYKAMKTILSERFPDTPISALFVARTIHQTT